MRNFLYCGTACAALLAAAQVGLALENGDFEAGLGAWKAAWHVSASAGEAVLTDTQDTHAFLFQSVTGLAGAVTVSFDFRDELAGTIPAGTFLDSFYASVYEVDTLSDFILENNRFDAVHGLMDLDANGAFDVHGAIGPSPKGEGWSRFSATFSANHTQLVIAFELHDLNLVSGDSVVRIDNVAIIPEGGD